MNEVSKGYVSVHREIMDHWLWQEKPVSKGQAWVDLILLANYKQEKFPYKGGVIEGQRGTVYRSIKFLSDRWGWSRDKTRRFLELLQDDGMVILNATTHQTTITIVNYGKYQNQVITNNATIRQQSDSKPTTDQQQPDTYNKDNKGNKSNKGDNSSGVPQVDGQTPEEIEEAKRWFNSL